MQMHAGHGIKRFSDKHQQGISNWCGLCSLDLHVARLAGETSLWTKQSAMTVLAACKFHTANRSTMQLTPFPRSSRST